MKRYKGLFVSHLLYIPLMTTKRRRRSIKLLACPLCGQIGTLRKIIYGMPDPESFDFEKYAVGGCCMNGDGSDPDVSCRECDWSGFRDQVEEQ
jgi:4-hydroxy-3-methylbut-2-en-1-yl diphosphate synthase IspG/GcpE